MALSEYKKKRKFNATPEPEGGSPADGQLIFVVQQHKASRLHYDFRLEVKGHLKSWAVPKGPSLNPEDKRLAVQVEDHPYDYKDFEGVIPEGNYGAGTVIVWDKGIYNTLEQGEDKKAMEKSMMKQWKEGEIKILLKGSKLKGEFVLVRMKGENTNNWLLIKHNDRFASDKDITKNNKSVLSKKTLEQIGKQHNERKQSSSKKSTKETPDEDDSDAARINDIIKKGKQSPFPESAAPMFASTANEVFDHTDWIYEIKWDGYRALAGRYNKKCTLISRNGLTFEKKFPQVFNAIKNWPVKAVVDGEIVALNDAGLPDFNRLQNLQQGTDDNVQYYVFDILWYNGKDITTLPLLERQLILKSILPEDNDIIKASFSASVSGTEFLNAASGIGLEGIMAKRADSLYYPGQRTKDWLKIKLQKSQEAVIAGYTRKKGSPRYFSSLLLGVYKNGKLQYAGKVGTGFKEKEQKALLEQFNKLVRKTSPFINEPDINKFHKFNTPVKTDVIWLDPNLVCEINFTEITKEGIFRHPSFKSLREDKLPKTIYMEKTIKTKDNMNKDKIADEIENKKPRLFSVLFSGRKLVRKINGEELTFTNPNKVLWPEDGYTKAEMLDYYFSIANYILPYLKNRPQSLHRFPDGIDGESFYQKDVTHMGPEWIERFPYRVEGEKKRKHYMLCNNKAALLYMANLGCIEMNPWNSTILRPDLPTWCVLDLDPDKSNTFEQVIETAQQIHSLLEDIKVQSYCKTSGSTGIHIYIPLKNQYTYDQSQLLAKWIATEVSQQLSFTSIERMTEKRKGKIYIDYLQNRSAATLAAPYSLRPKPGATVSMPLHWEEVKKGLQIADFNIKNAYQRIVSEGDIFQPVLGNGIHLKKALDYIQEKSENT